MPGGTRLAAAFRDESASVPRKHVLALYRVKTVENFEFDAVAEVANPHPGPVTALSFARNGRLLATGAEDGSVLVWDLSEGMLSKPRTALVGVAAHRVYGTGFQQRLALPGGGDVGPDEAEPSTSSTWIPAGWCARFKLERQLTGVAWHPDGHTLLTAGVSGTIKAWDVAALVKGTETGRESTAFGRGIFVNEALHFLAAGPIMGGRI